MPLKEQTPCGCVQNGYTPQVVAIFMEKKGGSNQNKTTKTACSEKHSHHVQNTARYHGISSRFLPSALAATAGQCSNDRC